MKYFEYISNPIVGVLSINGNSGNGYVNVLGFMNGDIFYRLSKSEAVELFAPDGSVFANKIQQKYYGLDKSLVSMFVQPNIKEGGKNAYLWNWDYEVCRIGSVIVRINDRLRDDGGRNYDILKHNDLLERKKDVFFISEDKLFFISKDDCGRLIPYCELCKDLPIVSTSTEQYYMENNLLRIDGYVDITSGQQLVDWFVRLMDSNWYDITNGTGDNALQVAKDALNAMKNLPAHIAESRFQRLQKLTSTYTITRDNLQAIASAPWFKPTVESAVDRYKDDFLGDVKKDYQQELDKLTEAHKIAVEEEIEKHDRKIQSIQESTEKLEAQSKAKIKELNEQVAGAKTSLERLDVEIEKKQTELSSIQKSLDGILERKDDIIRDFNVVRDVLGLSEMKNVSATSSVNVQKLQSINFSDKRLPFYKGFENNIENCLSLSQTKIESISELARMHACYNVILLPNADMAMSIVAAAGKAFYRIAYVSVAWKSFNDVWANGLHRIVTHCFEMPDTIHYFVLRNINLSCLSNYLQPLADMQAGVLDSFPETDILFPDNLRVLLTVSDEELIPMSEGVLRYFGCVSRDIETGEHWRIDYSTAQCIGYLDTKLLSKAAEEVEEPNNYYQEYVDE